MKANHKLVNRQESLRKEKSFFTPTKEEDEEGRRACVIRKAVLSAMRNFSMETDLGERNKNVLVSFVRVVSKWAK